MAKILVINPGSSSTKIALYNDEDLIGSTAIRHEMQHSNSHNVYDEIDIRVNLINSFLMDNNNNVTDIDVFVGRGGLLKPIHAGTYLVNDNMVEDLRAAKYGNHPCNLGGILAYEFAKKNGKNAYIVDPVVVDEMDDIARVSGYKGLVRLSIFHALNQRAVGHLYAKDIKKKYEDLNLIVVHLGSGISVGLHKKGHVVDVNNALSGDGPLSSERSGTLPTFQLIDLCFNSGKTADEIKKMIVGKGGLVSYLNTSNGHEIRERVDNGDKEACFYMRAMAYQIAKEIGALYFASKGIIDAVILTGGLANYTTLVDMIKAYSEEIVKTVIYPGEDEMNALVAGVLRILRNEESLQYY
jgi:butyrate kinase